MTADREKTIECLPTCWSPPDPTNLDPEKRAGGPKKYEPIQAGDYIKTRLNATY